MTELLYAVKDSIAGGRPLTVAEGEELYACTDLLELGRLAETLRHRQADGNCTLIKARRIRYSNVCRNQCSYCAKAKRPGEDGAYQRTVDEVVDLVDEAVSLGFTQFQLAGGASPSDELDYFLEMLSALRARYPQIHLQGFAPAQLVNIANVARLSSTEVLAQLRGAGLDSLLEDGADIFDPAIRRVLCRTKATGGQWLQVMREAHGMGMLGGASMLYGHYEGREEKIEHLCHLRDLQDETGRFTFYAPRTFRAENNLANAGALVGGVEDLREFAVGRIFLSTFPHLRCYANDLGMKTTQIALNFGVDTVVVVTHDHEPLRDEDRADAGLPNLPQLRELVERVGLDIREGTLDQRLSPVASSGS
jgi:aminodeoxyfutalosine synthase